LGSGFCYDSRGFCGYLGGDIMKKRRCDCCKVFYDSKPNRLFDLCDKCYKKPFEELGFINEKAAAT
jgi:hypothetical protein